MPFDKTSNKSTLVLKYFKHTAYLREKIMNKLIKKI